MAKEKPAEGNVGPSGQAAAPPLPPGVKLLRTLEGPQDVVRSVAFDPQGGALASGSADNTVKLWEARSGKLLRTLEGHKAELRSVAFDPQDGMLASGSSDKTVKLWGARSGKLLHTLEGHTDSVVAVAFSRDGRLLPSKSDDKTIRLLSCETWETVAVIPQARMIKWNSALAFHPTLPLLATTGSKPDASVEEQGRLIQPPGSGRARSITRRGKSCWWAITAWANRRWAIA